MSAQGCISWSVETDLKKLLHQLRQEQSSDRKKVTIYVSESVFEEFKKLCAEVSASRVIETWMQQAIDESKKRR